MNVALTQDRLKQLVSYNAETGVFTWLVPRGRVTPGKRAGAPRRDGRWRIRVDGHKYYSARLVWMYVYGSFPKGEIAKRRLHEGCTL